MHLVSFVRSAAEDANARALSHLCSGITTLPLRRSRLRDGAFLLRSLVTRRPFLIERTTRLRCDRLSMSCSYARRFDAVHADQLSMAQFAVDLKLPLRVLDDHNAVWSIVQRAAMHEGWGIRRILAELEWRGGATR